jgi:hypothetical protein
MVYLIVIQLRFGMTEPTQECFEDMLVLLPDCEHRGWP